MGLLILASTNPQFSYVIGKNPSSPPLEKAVSKGHARGAFSPSASSYYVRFQDDVFDSSYSESFEYLNGAQYYSVRMYQNLLEEYFGTLRNKGHKDDTEAGYTHSLRLNLVRVRRDQAIFRHLAGAYKDFQLSAEDVPGLPAADYCTLTIETHTRSLQAVLQFAYVVLLVTGKGNFTIDAQSIQKLLRQIVALGAEYYVRYYLSSRLLQSRKEFAACKPMLETHPSATLSLHYGTTQQQRKDWIVRFLSPGSILEVGCGPGYYAMALAPQVPTYYAVDTDAAELGKLRAKASEKQLHNICCFQSFAEWKLEELKEPLGAVLMTEVLEHMAPKEAVALLADVLTTLPSTRVIITMPNREFNVHYGFGPSEMRHEDHHFEPSRAEFEAFIHEAAPSRNGEYFAVGDVVNGVSVSHGYVFS